MFMATVSIPGHAPMDVHTATFETPTEAWWHLYHARCDAERNAACDLCNDTMTHGPFGDCDDDSETGRELAKHARWAASGLICDFEAVGTIHGPTPGFRGSNDPGLAYVVSETEG